jgi:hypothetical protein
LVFNSDLDGLVPEDQDHLTDAFVFNASDGTNALVSQYSPGQEEPVQGKPAPAFSFSGDGRSVLFGGMENSLEPLADHVSYVFLRDLTAATTDRVDFSELDKSMHGSTRAILAPDGQTLALTFSSYGPSSSSDIFLQNRSTGEMVKVTTATAGRPANGESYLPTFSPDGRYLAFVSTASNLVASDTPCSEANRGCADVFLYDIPAKMLTRIPARIALVMGTPTFRLTVSNQASFIAWADLEEPEKSYRPVVRLYNRQTGKTETICAGETFCTGHTPSISADGRWLAFASIPAHNAEVKTDTSSYAQVYLLDRNTYTLSLLSENENGEPGNGHSGMIQLQPEGFSSDVQISGDGRFIAFSSQAQNLLPKDNEKRQCFNPVTVGPYACYDLFLYNRQEDTLSWISHLSK